ncbi:MAG: SUF system NifU family Fe-S cluster assembly protein [Actinomycetota bacterium]|jgi:nitrogen fixation NifU-like protein
MAGMEDLYKEIIMDHYRSPRNRGELLSPPATRTEGFNPLCGDEIVMYLIVKDGVLTDIKMTGQGCSISQASASLMSAAVKGKPLSDVRERIDTFKALMTVHEAALDGEASDAVDLRRLGELAALQGVVKFPVRIKCATLAWNTLIQGLEEISPT